jgi:CHAD domain-containing protein
MLGSASYPEGHMSPAAPTPLAALRVLSRAWSRAREGDADALHDVRVATRRLREALRLAAGHARERHRLRQRLRRLTRALGPVREIDVSRNVLASLAAARPDLAKALARVDARLTELGAARRARFRTRMDEIDVAALVVRISRHLARVKGDRAVPSALDRGRLAALVAERVDCAAKAAEAAGAMYAPERLHDVRIATKKLRYALEIARQVRVADTADAISRLRACQDLLGELHDLQVVSAQVRRQQARMPADDPDLAKLSDLLSHIEDRCRELHATFVGRRAGLVALADELAGTFTRLTTAAQSA